MAHRITLSDPTHQMLDREARRVQLTPDALAERLLADRLSQDYIAWRQAVEQLLAEVQSRTAEFSAEEIEANITAASEEARAIRRARRAG